MYCIATYQLKGGVGKTATAVNIAALAAAEGWPTLLWDLDAQGAASYLLGIDDADVKAKKLISGEQPAGRLVRSSKWRHLEVIPAARNLRHLDGRLHQAEAVSDWLRQAVRRFSESYRLVVLDCPAGLGALAESVFNAADLLLMPSQPGPLAQRAVDQVLQHLSERKAKPPLVRPFFSMVDRRRQLHRAVAEKPSAHLHNASPVTIPSASIIERMGVERAPLPAFAPRSDIALLSYQALWRDVQKQLRQIR